MANSGQDEEEANFEDAITATKFGAFNIILLILSFAGGCCYISELTVITYVFPAAQCDLDLSMNDKGVLNAISFIGMLCSGFVMGYLIDVFGRRQFLYVGYFINLILVISASLSQTFTFLLVVKFFGGLMINAPFGALTTYLSEVHCVKYRSMVQMVLATIFSSAAVILPILGRIILPADIQVTLFDSLKIHPWNVLLFATIIFPLVGMVGFYFLPESPKFLMANGRVEEAMNSLQFMYRLNTGKPRDTYPYTKLVNEKKLNKYGSQSRETMQNSTVRALVEGCLVMKILFIPPFLRNLILVCLLQMTNLMSWNNMRLWVPQLFQAVADYAYHNNGSSSDLCTMLKVMHPGGHGNSTECMVNTDNALVYTNSLIIAAVTVVGSMVAGSVINCMGKKKLMYGLGLVTSLSGYGLYFSQSTFAIVGLCSTYNAAAAIGFNLNLAIIVELFPTSLRTVCIGLAMTTARVGTITNNLIFPFLLKTGCAATFFTMGTIALTVFFLALFLPNTDKAPLL